MRTLGLPLSVIRSDARADAFARMRTSTPFTIFDSKQLLDAQSLHWDDAETSGSGTGSSHSANAAASTLTVGATAAGTRVRQTKRRFNYQPGKSQLILLTGVLGAGTAGITRRMGYFDASNGIFLEQAGTALRFVIRSYVTGAPVDTVIEQADWNIDPMNGTGSSGYTVDPTKAQIVIFDFEWLGVGDVRFGFVIDGQIMYCHAQPNANRRTGVYMSTPNLPLRYEISNSGAGPAASLVHICSTVISEGGFQELGYPFALHREGFATNNDANVYPLTCLRFKSGRFNEATVKITGLNVVCATTAVFRWALLLNPTIAGAALVYTGMTNSALEYNIVSAVTNTLTGGRVIACGIAQATNDSPPILVSPADFYPGATIAGVSDIIVLAVQRLTGTSETFYSAINWRELL